MPARPSVNRGPSNASAAGLDSTTAPMRVAHDDRVADALDHRLELRRAGLFRDGKPVQPVLVAAPLDRRGKNVGHRLQEVDVVVGEHAVLGGVRAEHAEWMPGTADDDCQAAHHAVVDEQRRRAELSLCREIVEHHRSDGRERVATLRAEPALTVALPMRPSFQPTPATSSSFRLSAVSCRTSTNGTPMISASSPAAD